MRCEHGLGPLPQLHISGLRPMNEKERAGLEAFKAHMRDVVIPEIVRTIRARQRRAVDARHRPIW